MTNQIIYALLLATMLCFASNCENQSGTGNQQDPEAGTTADTMGARGAQALQSIQLTVSDNAGTLSGVIAKVNGAVINAGGTSNNGQVKLNNLAKNDILMLSKTGYQTLEIAFIEFSSLTKLEIKMVLNGSSPTPKRVIRGKVYDAIGDNIAYNNIILRDKTDNDPLFKTGVNGEFNLDYGTIDVNHNSSFIDFILPESLVRLLLRGTQETIEMNVYLADGPPIIGGGG